MLWFGGNLFDFTARHFPALLANKVTSLVAQEAEYIATANIGCHLHLQSGTDVPVVHWVELLADRLRPETGEA